MKMFTKSYGSQLFVVFAALVATLGTVMMPVNAGAALFDGWYASGGVSEGYFSNGGASDLNPAVRDDCGSSKGCAVLPNDDYSRDSLDGAYYRNNSAGETNASSEAKARRLVFDLKNYYDNHPGWGRAGSAFIVNTMLGRTIDNPNKSRTVTAADWSELEKRLINRANAPTSNGKGRIDWNVDFSSEGRNTASKIIKGQWDVSWYPGNNIRNGLIIYNDDGSAAYRMWYLCANPVGNFSGLPSVPAAQWDINGQSYVKNFGATSSPDYSKDGSVDGRTKPIAYPGDKIAWYHDLRRTGPDNMDRPVYFHIEKTGLPSSYTTEPRGYAQGWLPPNDLFVREYANMGKPTDSQLRYTVQPGDVDKEICQRITWLPGSSSYGSWAGAQYGGACVKVERNFNLVPSIKDTPGVVEPGTEVTITPEVNNTGKTSSDPNAQWQLVKVTVPKGSGGIPRVDDTTRSTPGSPCPSYYGSRCEVIDSHSGTKPGGFTTGVTKDLPEYPYNVGDLEVGDRICFGLSVRPQSNESGNWRHSTLKCVTVGKRPSVNVVGGDVIVGRASGKQDIVTSLTAKKIYGEDRIFGSWGEYALIADGRILGMASAAGLAGSNGKAGSSINMCQVSYLTITNAGTGSSCDENKLGNYATGNGAPPISSGFPAGTTALSGTRSIDSIPGSNDTYRVNDGATLTISGGPVQRGKSVVINAPRSNVVISGNINYDGGEIASITDIPQVVIIANTITINENVTNVDAWLIASGEAGVINTCNSVTAFGDLDANKCTNRLTVNGPVLANKLNLYRTAGSGKASESRQPAETFNLRPDAYLWATGYRNGSSFRLQTENTIELPPRY